MDEDNDYLKDKYALGGNGSLLVLAVGVGGELQNGEIQLSVVKGATCLH